MIEQIPIQKRRLLLDVGWVLKSPDKWIKLVVDPHDATTFIHNKRRLPWQKPKGGKGQTTALYVEVSETLQKEADRRGKSIVYHFKTANPKMIDWYNEGRGKEILRLENVAKKHGELTGERRYDPRRIDFFQRDK